MLKLPAQLQNLLLRITLIKLLIVPLESVLLIVVKLTK